MRMYIISDLQFHFILLEYWTHLDVRVLTMQVYLTHLKGDWSHCLKSTTIHLSSFLVLSRAGISIYGSRTGIMVSSMWNDFKFLRFLTKIAFASRAPSSKLKNSIFGSSQFRSRSLIYQFVAFIGYQTRNASNLQLQHFIRITLVFGFIVRSTLKSPSQETLRSEHLGPWRSGGQTIFSVAALVVVIILDFCEESTEWWRKGSQIHI